MSKIQYDELVQLLQDGRIGHLEFVMNTDSAEYYLAWCETHGTEPSDDSAEFFNDLTEIDMMERQLIDDEEYGVWN